ncbi:MAG: formyltransferase family protein, partial [bacterium]|nr:formyltransferase family protein [bacterium]
KKYYVVDGNNNDKIYDLLKENEIDLVLCYSWSWILKEPVTSQFICLCLHPAPVPKYRGGTPIQHQILSGEIRSAVSIFRMSPGIDDGPLYSQTPISLEGDIEDIYARMVKVGISKTRNLIKDYNNGKLKFTPQKNLDTNPPWKRRKPEQSELTFDQLSGMTFRQLHNFVRALTGPYPHAYIQLGAGRLYLLSVAKSSVSRDVLNFESKVYKRKKVTLKIRDTYVQVNRFTFEPLKKN